MAVSKQMMLPIHRAFNSDGAPEAGAKAFLYLSGGLTPANFYSDAGLTTSIGHSITANSAGRFSPMPYGDSTVKYRLIIQDSQGAELDDIDPFYFGLVDPTVYSPATSNTVGTADGVTDNLATLQSAIDTTYSVGGGVVLLPPGVLMTSGSIIPKPGVILRGQGKGVTTLKASGDGYRILDKHLLGRSGAIGVEKLTLWGYGDRNLTQGGDTTRNAVIGPCNDGWYEEVESIYCRQMSLCIDALRARVNNCYVHKGFRDGINLTGCNYVDVSHNVIEEVSDDSIAVHLNSAWTGLVEFGCRIIGNRIHKAYGIKVLGARNTVIQGNTLRFYYGYGIQVGLDSNSGEGLAARFNVSVTGNTLLDGLNATAVGGGNVFYSIWLNGGASVGTGGTAITTLPGNYDSTNHVFVLPAPYVNQAGSAYPRPSDFNVIVSGNTVAQTIGPKGNGGSAMVNLSDAGFGQIWTATGYADPAITTLIRQLCGMFVTGDWEGLSIVDNSFNGMLDALRYAPSTNFKNVRFAGNNIYRCQNAVKSNLVSLKHVGLVIENNDINLDPYFESPLRTGTPIDGTWNVNGGLDWYAFMVDYTVGAVITNNRIRNVMQTMRALNGAMVVAQGNHLFWDWSGASVKGIGSITGTGTATNFQYYQVSDPNSASYGQYSTTADSAFVQSATAMPTTGYYRGGQVVKNSATLTKDANNMVLWGWLRLTVGNTHTLGTDWTAMYISAVSPAT